MSKSIIEKLLPDLNSKLKAQGFYLEMLEVLIEEWKFIESYLASNASRNDGYWYNEFLNRQNTIKKAIEKACYPKKWEEIRSYYE